MVRSTLLFGICLMAGWACSGKSERTPPAAAQPVAVTVPGMKNAVEVGDLLFGAQPSREALAELKAKGYKTIVSTRGAGELPWDEGAVVDSLGLRFASVPMEKPVTAITDDEVARFASLMATEERPMVLHCGSGNRVAGLWAVWLVEYEGVSRDEALSLAEKAGMKGIRPVVEARLNQEGGE